MKTEHTYGEWLQLQSHLLWAYDHLKPAWTTPTEWQREMGYNSAWLVREGWAEVRCDGGVCRAGKGEWLLVPPRTRQQRFSPKVHILSVAFRAQWLDGRHWYDHGLPLVVNARSIPHLEKAGRQLARVVKRAASEVDGDMRRFRLIQRKFLWLMRALPNWLEVYAAAMDQCGVRSSRPHAVDDRVEAAQRLLKTWPLHEPLDANGVARDCGLSRRQLERLFLMHFHTTPHRYLEQLRLQDATVALQQRNAQVKVVALRLGFSDASHFSHWFCRRTGSSPRAFRGKTLC
ncbi:MAG: AraC family transcriptional regulator [Verrucomicrobiia bacterium]|jgi:AraC-like DNA-binding protein